MKTIGPQTTRNTSNKDYLQLVGIDLAHSDDLTRSSKYESDGRYKVTHIDSPNISEMIIPNIIKYIREKALALGDKLPPEKELCEMIGVGNRAMREALMVLRSTGLLQAQTGKGWYVGKFDPGHSLRFLSPLLHNLPDAEDFDQVLDARLVIEPGLTGLTAKNIPAENLKQLEQIMEKMRYVDEYKKDRKPDDIAFHTTIARNCGNNILMMVNSILIDLMGTMLETLEPMELHSAYETHYPIYEAIKLGDQEKAEKAAIKHIQDARDIIHRHLES